MGIVDLETPSLDRPYSVPDDAFVTAGSPQSKPPSEAPSFGATLGAAFRSENMVGSLIANMIDADSFPTSHVADPTFNTWEEIKGGPYESYWNSFLNVHNRQELELTKKNIDRENEDRKILADAPWYKALPASLAANFVDPSIAIPGGAFVKGVKGGFSVAKSALSVGASAGAMATAQEAGLLATQQTRTPTESAVNIGSSTLLGMLLGGAGSALLSKLEWSAAVRGIDRDVSAAAPASLGAAANTAPSLADMATAGMVARGFEKTTPGLNPHTRWANSPSPAAKELALNLAETTKYTQGNLTGIASPTAAETLRKEWDAGVSSAVIDMNAGYSAYRKGGGTLKRDAFENEVGMAMRRNDQHAIPEVQKAAASWRKNVFEPAKDAAIEEKLLPADVDVKTAASYYSRMWNRGKLNAEEHEFKSVVKNWAEGNMPRWQQDFDLAATEKIGKAEADFAKAKLGKDAGKIAETERALNDLRTETRTEREARFSGKNLGEDLANEVFAKLTGRTSDGTRPEYITIASRGPLKERTFNIPDELAEPWLESNINIVGRRYNRIMSADIELARLDRRMGGEGTPDLKGALQKVRDDYANLRAGVTDEKELLKLAAKEKSDMRDLEGVRDIMRHTFELGANDSNWGRIVRMGNAFNYIRMMGNVVLASLGDAIRVPMVHGLSAALQGAGAALKDLGTFKLSVREARLAGNVNDGVLAHRLATFAEISDYTTSRGPVEKFLYNMVNVASHWNGIQLWTDSMKSIASVVTQNRILENARNFAGAAARDKKYLAFLGVDESMAARIAKQFEEHGETLNGVHVAGTENWTDDVARRTYRAALNKDVDSIVPTVGIADKPLMANTPIGRALLQFNMFNLAANQRIMLRGLQEGPTRFLSGVVALTTLGMFQTYLYAVINNRVDKLPDPATNLGWWIGEGLDRSGAVITVFFQMANGMEKLTGLNPIKAPMRAFDKGTQESERNIHRNLSSVLGPTAGDVENVMTATGVPKKLIQGDDLSKQQKQALEQLIPFQSYFGIRQLLRYVVNPEH